jgi:rhamnose utilization protein RhaD (predicted bifunctional aldolase and dehydrogenase)
MDKQGIQELIQISHYAAADVAYIQGGGGNTSVKLDDTRMAVKASGCQLSDMAEKEGYVVVDYKRIKNYFNGADSEAEAFEAESGQVLKDAKVVVEGLKELRPSVEAGFHSLLKKYVVHTHSVYSNILCCSSEGKGIATELFKDKACLWLPYVNPGAVLTSVIAKAILDFGQTPEMIFMENHGVIVTGDTAEESIELHELVNNRIKEQLKIKDAFPSVSVEEQGNKVVSTSDYVKEYFADQPLSFEFVREKVLYPDQLVYLNNSIFKKDGGPSDIVFEGNQVVYKTSKKQAQVNEETLVAYLYVLNLIKKKDLTLVSMTHDQQAFILGWESEAYRKSMLK